MVFPEIRSIHSPDIDPPTLPDDPYDCDIRFRAVIGPADQPGEETFEFSVITPTRLARSADPLWGRGRLIMPMFEWAAVIQSVATLLARAARPTWAEVAVELNKDLFWDTQASAQPDA